MARPRTPRLSKDRIRDEALAIGDEHGLAAATMRALAERLGVQPSSLYSHFPTKDHVLDAVANRLVAEVDTSGFRRGWREGLFTWARSYHAALAAHPNADRKSTRLNSSHVANSYAVICLKKKRKST